MMPPATGRLKSLRLISKHQLNFIAVYSELKERLGDVFTCYLPSLRYVISHPDFVRYVLKDNHSNYTKSADYNELKPMLGNGLLTSEGESWRKERRIISAEFVLEQVKKQGEMITSVSQRFVNKWRERARSGETFDVSSDMMALTFEIAGNAFFGAELGPNAEAVCQAFTDASSAAVARMLMLVRFPMSFPTPTNRKYRKAVAVLDAVLFDIIEKRQKSGDERHDLLSRLLISSRAEKDPISAQLLRDELITIMLAGHETTSLALTWTWFLLSQHPHVAKNLQDELNRVLSGRAPTVNDLPQLPYNRMVIQESMRLYPPAPSVSRTPVKDDEIGGFRILAGSLLTCPASIVHRDPRFWNEPTEFNPQRFSTENLSKIYPFSYIPFGAGPRICVGEQFAMMEAQLVLATMAPFFTLEIKNPSEVIAHPLITLRPKNGILARVRVN